MPSYLNILSADRGERTQTVTVLLREKTKETAETLQLRSLVWRVEIAERKDREGSVSVKLRIAREGLPDHFNGEILSVRLLDEQSLYRCLVVGGAE